MDHEQPAIEAGFTRQLCVTSSGTDLYLLVRDDADLDGTFRAYDTDAREWIDVHGWQVEIGEDYGPEFDFYDHVVLP